ncbi:MAG: redoxin domain-containing protein [Candidatus Methylomirabilales bacterium]
MVTSTLRPPVQPGEAAPSFALPWVDREGTVSLSDYRGKPLFLALFRGIYCPFCRRAIDRLAASSEALRAIGVEALGIVATKPENARLYFRHRPTRMPLAADPELHTHRAYGLPKPELTPDLLHAMQTVPVNPTGELPQPLPPMEASPALDRIHGFKPTEIDEQDRQRQTPQLQGEFLVDRDGIVRWVNIECAKEGVAGIGKVPAEEEILSAARSLPGRPARLAETLGRARSWWKHLGGRA